MATVNVSEMLEHVPAVALRLSHQQGRWKTLYITQNIAMFGYTREEFMRGEVTWQDLVHPNDRVMVNKTVEDYEAHNVNQFRLHYRVVTRDGDSIPITEYNTVNRDDKGRVESYDTFIVNNAAPVASQDLIDNHYRQQIVLNDILLSLHDSDLEHALQIILNKTGEYLNTSRALLFQDSEDHSTCKVICEWDNSGISSVMDLDYSITYATSMPEIYVALQTTGSLLINYGEIPESCKEEFDAEGLVASAIFAVYLNGRHFGFVCFDDCVEHRVWDEDTVRFLKNVSNLISTVLARRHTAQQLAVTRKDVEEMAFTDYLTKLANRFSCDYELQHAIEHAAAAGKTGHVLFLDLDDFKIVNDCYGHDYGDAILITLAKWLRSMFPPPHRVFRFGGDEFVVLLHHEVPMPVKETLAAMHERAMQPWESLDKEFYCTLSMGVVPYPGEDRDSRTVIKQADIAMYEAKRLGKNRHTVYNDSLDSSSRQRTDTEQLLRRAMKNGFEGFELYYQPIVNTATGAIEGAEALLRINDGNTVVMPRDFLPLAEYLGFTVAIGEHVLETAMRECKRVNESGFPHFKMCVNMTQKQLRQRDVLHRLEAILSRVGVAHQNVVIAVSEGMALEDAERMHMVCGRLQQLGIEVTLDDFGGGSASFLQLGHLPVDTITTSMSLLANIEDHYAREFIKLVINLCHSMDKQVCINGIENEAQYRFCQENSPNKLQGFYLYKVVNADTLQQLLR